MDQEGHFDHQVRIGRIGHVRFLDRGVDIHGRGVGKAQLGGPDGDHIGHLALRFWREARTKRFDLGVVRRVPWVDETSSAQQLVGCIVLKGPFDLAISEVIEPLEQEGPEVDTPCQFSAKPPFALGGGALQIWQDHIGEGLPRNNASELDQRMCGGDLDGHGLQTAGGVESRETNAHGEDAFSVAGDLVLLASDHEGIIVLEQWQSLTNYYSLYKYIMRQSINPKSRIFQQLRISRQRPNSPLKHPMSKKKGVAHVQGVSLNQTIFCSGGEVAMICD